MVASSPRRLLRHVLVDADNMTKVAASFFFLFLVMASPLSQGHPRTVGPDWGGESPREKFLREHPIFQALSRRAKPPHKPRNRTLIDMSLAIHSIDFDMSSGTFKTNGHMMLTWNDPRYGWNLTDYSSRTSFPLPFYSSWAPEVILHNAFEEKFNHRQVGVIRQDGNLVYLIAIHTKSSCTPNFENDGQGGIFPFNVQTCNLRFGSWINEQYQVEYRLPAQKAIDLQNFSHPSGWEIVATEAKLESIHYPMFYEPSHHVVFTFSAKRKFFYDPVSGMLWKEKQDTNMNNRTATYRGDQSDF